MINGMTIETYVIAYNETIMFPWYYEHYSKFVDKITVFDNDSTDGTQDLVVKLGKEGPVPTELRHYETNKEQDNLAMQTVKNTCWKDSKSDWVIVGDMDEMLWDWENIGNYKPDNIVIKPKGYNMSGNIDMEEGTIWSIDRGHEIEAMDKMILFNPTIQEIDFSVGAHWAEPKGATIINDMRLFHYAYINEEYIINKHKKYAVRMSANDIKMKFGEYYLWTGEKMRKQYRAGQLQPSNLGSFKRYN